MNLTEFKVIAATLKASYQSLRAFDTDEGLRIWYEMLKDLEYKVISEAVSMCVKESPYPPAIADIRKICKRLVAPDWSVEWQKLIRGAAYTELNAPAQYALKTLTRECLDEMLENRQWALRGMKEFERLYENYFHLTDKDKKALMELGVWKRNPGDMTGFISSCRDGVESSDRFMTLNTRIRADLEERGIIQGQTLALRDATEEDVRLLQEEGLL